MATYTFTLRAGITLADASVQYGGVDYNIKQALTDGSGTISTTNDGLAARLRTVRAPDGGLLLDEGAVTSGPDPDRRAAVPAYVQGDEPATRPYIWEKMASGVPTGLRQFGAADGSTLPVGTSVVSVADYSALAIGATVGAGMLVTYNGALYKRISNGTIPGSFTRSEWTQIVAGGATSEPVAPLYLGNALPTEYTGEPNIRLQQVGYFGSYFPNGWPLTGRPQTGRVVAKYAGPTPDDSAQAYSHQLELVDTGTPFTQTNPATADEANVLVDGANVVSGKAVAHSFSVEARGTSWIQQPRVAYFKNVAAVGAGSRVDDWVGVFFEDVAAGSAGSVVDREAIHSLMPIHFEAPLTFGTLTAVKGYLNAQANSGASTITLESGQGAAFTAGNTLMIGTGALAEARTIQSIAGDVLTLTAPTLTKTHPKWSRIRVYDANGLGNLYMSAGNVTSDFSWQMPGILPGQIVVRFVNGQGYIQEGVQSTDPGSPSSGNIRSYWRNNSATIPQRVAKFSDGTIVPFVQKDGHFMNSTTAAATTLGTVTRKLPVYDVDGTTVLGYVPLYGSIT